MTQLKVQSIALDALVHDPRNPRLHDKRNIDIIKHSLVEHSQVEPLVVQANTMMVIGGNGRLEAMRALGWKTAACALVDISDTQARRLSIALNRTAELAEWDDRVLAKHLEELSALNDWSLEDLGFNDDELKDLADAFGVDDDVDDDVKRTGGLVADFGAPPFTVLDTRQGYWKERREWWWSIGLDASIGREHLVSTANTQAESKYKYMGGRGASKGGSAFDPVLAELMVLWHSAPGESILDPFAGGPVRGVVAAALGREYTGIDVRQSQVTANDSHWRQIKSSMPTIGAAPRAERPDYQPDLTPIECVDGIYVKRDDLYTVAGVSGGKVRSCWHLAQGASGLVTAGSRSSPQVNIVAHIAKRLDIPCRVHTPAGDASPEVADAIAAGATRVTHKPGHNSVIIKRARDDAEESGWTEIPFGMQCDAAVQQTRGQVADIPDEVTRVVIPVGSGMSLAGVLWGLDDIGSNISVLGVVVGADPTKRLDQYAPPDWRARVTLVDASVDYHEEVHASVGHVLLDPNYEAKCAEHLMPDDMLWIVGIRRTADPGDTAKMTKISSAWATKRVDCTTHGITKAGGCAGKCCVISSFWPAKANDGGPCAHLGDAGCTLKPKDRPATCHLFPMIINKSGTMVGWGQMMNPTSICGPCANKGPMLIEAIRPGLEEIMPDTDWDDVTARLIAGNDVDVVLPADIVRALRMEESMDENLVTPLSRQLYAPAVSATPVHQPDPEWVFGDAMDIDTVTDANRVFDALVTCPPYADLERYSDDPRDISTMEYDTFIPAFAEIMSRAVARLKDGAFAAVVVGEIRGKSGGLRGFVNDTVRIMRDAGCTFYNDAILVNSAGTAPIRAASYFNGGRKLVRVHQNVLIFYKGDKPRKDLPPRPAVSWATDDD